MFITLIIIFLLLLLSAFFSGSETALTGASRPLMHQLERTGGARARIVNGLHLNKGRLLGGILIGNNLVNIFASALATSALFGMFGDAGIVYATLIMTALIVLFAEVLPKTYALHNADRVALWIAPIIRPIILLFSPLSSFTQFVETEVVPAERDAAQLAKFVAFLQGSSPDEQTGPGEAV